MVPSRTGEVQETLDHPDRSTEKMRTHGKHLSDLQETL
jgi:hypothetical protein